MHEDASQSIGNDFFDFGGGNSRSRSVRSSFVNLILREAALSRTCASVLAFGIAITSGWRNTQASAIWAGVASWACAIFFSAAFLSNAPLRPTGEYAMIGILFVWLHGRR